MLTANLIDGKEASRKLLDECRETIREHDLNPSLHVVFVGDDEASRSYIRMKERKAEEVGIQTHVHHFPPDVDPAAVSGTIQTLNDDPAVHGIIVQLPLPGNVEELALLETVDPRKDVDGLHPLNFGKLLGNAEPHFYPPTPRGITNLLDEYDVPVTGAVVTLVGMGRLVGRPLAQMLLNRDATTLCLNEDTPELVPFTRRADILVAGAGVPRLINEEHVSEGTVVIDAGIHRINGELVGDVDFESVAPLARLITPVPGGVGPLTVAGLLVNTCTAALRHSPA